MLEFNLLTSKVIRVADLNSQMWVLLEVSFAFDTSEYDALSEAFVVSALGCNQCTVLSDLVAKKDSAAGFALVVELKGDLVIWNEVFYIRDVLVFWQHEAAVLELLDFVLVLFALRVKVEVFVLQFSDWSLLFDGRLTFFFNTFLAGKWAFLFFFREKLAWSAIDTACHARNEQSAVCSCNFIGKLLCKFQLFFLFLYGLRCLFIIFLIYFIRLGFA